MKIRQLAVALTAGAAALSMSACGSTAPPATTVAAASHTRTAATMRTAQSTAPQSTAVQSTALGSGSGTVLTTVTVTAASSGAVGSANSSGAPTDTPTSTAAPSTASTDTTSASSTPGAITSPPSEPNAPGTRPTQSDPSLKVLPGSVAPGQHGAPAGVPVTTSTTLFQPAKNPRTDPISTAAAFISLYAERDAGDSRAYNFAKRVSGFVTPQVQAQLDTESLTASAPEYGQTIGIITTANILEFPKPTPTTASVFVLYTSRTAMREQVVGQAPGIGKFVSVTRQKDGTWIVSGFKDAPN